ncbi:hypothetical protein ACRALDRAFT_1059831 [Sodiomyces alcalophilus JCM 7366]|uniref:uncharacterized protein n=1 Tax=Sodiomyces alcalophilus JCM 7366 TaxID=591952 RepID=UPI0039B66F77
MFTLTPPTPLDSGSQIETIGVIVAPLSILCGLQQANHLSTHSSLQIQIRPNPRKNPETPETSKEKTDIDVII